MPEPPQRASLKAPKPRPGARSVGGGCLRAPGGWSFTHGA